MFGRTNVFEYKIAMRNENTIEEGLRVPYDGMSYLVATDTFFYMSDQLSEETTNPLY